MKKGDVVYHKVHGLMEVKRNKYQRLGNKNVFFGTDESGKEHEIDDSVESPEKYLKEKEKKESPKMMESMAELLSSIQGPQGEKGLDSDEESIIEKVLNRIELPKDGKDGADADIELVARELLPKVIEKMPKPEKVNESSIVEKLMMRIKIPQDGKVGEKGKDGSPDTPKEIKGKLETLTGDERLDASAIKNLPKPIIGGGQSYTGLVKVDSTGTPGTLEDKLIAGSNITLTKTNDTISIASSGGVGGGSVDSVVAGNNIDVDATDPANPVVSATEVSLPEYLVSSSTAPADVIALADYVCDGTADQVQIQAAIDAAIAAGGGTVLLSGGTFSISAGISWAAHDINLRGQGQGATIITNSTGSANFDMITVGDRQSDGIMRNFNSVSDMTVTHAGGASTNACIKVDGGGRSGFIKNVQTNEGGIGIHFMDLDRYSIRNVDITNVRDTAMLLEVGAEGTFGKVSVEDSSMNLSDTGSICVRFDTTGSTNPFDVVSFKNCLFFSTANTASTIGAQFNLGGVDIHFDNCQFESPSLAHVELNDETRVRFTTCSFIQNGTLATTSGFRLVNDNHCVIIDSCVFQKMTTVFDSISGSPSLELGGWSKNNGNITNVFSGSFGLRTGIDTAFAGDNILQLGPSDKKFTSIYLTDDAYAAGWNADFRAPTKNAVYDKIEALAATIGTGDVVGPASATDKAVAIYNTTTGKLIQNSSVIINSSNISGVGTFTSTGLMSVTRSLTGGQILVSSSTTNSTDKFGDYAVRHYLSAEEPVGLIGSANGSSTNEVRIGGGFGEFNAATRLLFYTAANYNTTTGTERLSISSAGNVVFNEGGNDSDFRMEGDTDVNLFFLDASTDRIGIGTNTPGVKLDLGTSNALGCGTIELGHASDTTLSRSAAGVLAVEGVDVLTTSNTKTISNKSVSGALTLEENASIALDPAGSADGKYSGITVAATAGEALAFGDVIVLDVTAGKWFKGSVSAAAGADGDLRGGTGMCVLAAAGDASATTVLLMGTCRADANFPALTIGSVVYATTAGDITVTQPTTTDHVIKILGFALTADEIMFCPSMNWTTHV